MTFFVLWTDKTDPGGAWLERSLFPCETVDETVAFLMEKLADKKFRYCIIQGEQLPASSPVMTEISKRLQ
jgi:hypothetical protein